MGFWLRLGGWLDIVEKLHGEADISLINDFATIFMRLRRFIHSKPFGQKGIVLRDVLRSFRSCGHGRGDDFGRGLHGGSIRSVLN